MTLLKMKCVRASFLAVGLFFLTCFCFELGAKVGWATKANAQEDYMKKGADIAKELGLDKEDISEILGEKAKEGRASSRPKTRLDFRSKEAWIKTSAALAVLVAFLYFVRKKL